MRVQHERLAVVSSRRRRARRRRASQAGLTLVELLVAIAIFMVLTGAIVGITVQNQKIFVGQEEIAAAQQDARGALLVMSNSLLMAGCGVPVRLTDPGNTGLNVAFASADLSSVTFLGCFSDPAVRANLTAPATLNAAPGPLLTLTVDTAADFAVGNNLFLFSANRWARGQVTAIVPAVPFPPPPQPAQLTINFTVANVVPTTFPSGSLVYREESMTLALVGTTLQRTLSVPPAANDVSQLATTMFNQAGLPGLPGLRFTYWDPTGVKLLTPLTAADRKKVHRVGIDLTVQTQRRVPGSQAFQTVRVSTAVQPRNVFAN